MGDRNLTEPNLIRISPVKVIENQEVNDEHQTISNEKVTKQEIKRETRFVLRVDLSGDYFSQSGSTSSLGVYMCWLQ